MILLDTHVIVWLASNDPRLSKAATSAIVDESKGERGLAISDFTLYELSILFGKKPIALSATIESCLSEVERHFVILTITARVCAGTLCCYLPPRFRRTQHRGDGSRGRTQTRYRRHADP